MDEKTVLVYFGWQVLDSLIGFNRNSEGEQLSSLTPIVNSIFGKINIGLLGNQM